METHLQTQPPTVCESQGRYGKEEDVATPTRTLLHHIRESVLRQGGV